MSNGNGTKFKLVEQRGYAETELAVAPTLEELEEALAAKTGGGRDGD